MQDKLDLAQIRQEIDDIDESIVELFERRMEVCKSVAEFKIENNKKVFDKDREISKLNKVRDLAKNQFNEQGVTELFTQIMSISRKLQYQILAQNGISNDVSFECVDNVEIAGKRVVYQGVPGAYAHEATMNYFGDDSDNYNVRTFREVMEAVSKGEADFGVLPMENTTAGIVNDVYDLLVEFDNYIVDQIDVVVRHALLGIPGTKIEDINTVYSHPQGLMQCAEFLDEHREWQRIAQANTAGSAKKVVEEKLKNQAAIASVKAAKIYGLEVLKEDLVRNLNNTTRFIIVCNKKVYRSNSTKISMCFTLPHESGTLYNMLSHFIYNGLNMTKIESRPIREKSWEYRFFVEFEGKLNEAGTLNAIKGIKEEANSFKLLGNY